jgi:hypothetical protein
MTKANNKYHVSFYGNQMTLKHGKSRAAIQSTIISNYFVNLYYKLSEGMFDQDLFDKLSYHEKKLLNEIYTKAIVVKSKAYEIAMTKFGQHLLDRLGFLEAGMSSGEDSLSVKKEYSNILDELVSLNLIKTRLANRMKENLASL